MKLNIYYSKRLENKQSFEKFFIDNYLFKDRYDYLAGKLLDVYFYDIQKFKVEDDIFDIVLVDDYLIDELADDESINKDLKAKWICNNKSIVFVSLSKNFYQFKMSEEANLIRAFDKENLFEFLFSEITHDILRFLLDEEKLNIFISHAKSDGREIAKVIKEFIDSDLKLSNFFDEVDIHNSQKWDKKLEDSVQRSLFLYILSDNYAQTLWTKKELIFARENFRPMIGIDVLSKKTEVSPLIANTKLLKLTQNIQQIEVNCKDTYLVNGTSNIRYIINLLLKEALIFELVKDKTDLPIKPDLFDLCNINKNPIIYPDPPMMQVEKEILERCSNKQVITPMTKDLYGHNKQKTIAISISEPSDLEKNGIRIEHLNLLMIEIARYAIISGAKLIYGGDLGYKKEFNFTSILAETFRAYNQLDGKMQKKLINYAVYPFCEKIDVNLKNQNRDVIKFEFCIGKQCSIDDIGIIAQNLTTMREKITSNMDIKIAVGGKVTGFSGFYPGVLEEIYLALKANKSVILVEGFGGIVDKIIEFIRGDTVEEVTFDYQMRVNPRLEKYLKDSNKIDEVKNTYDNFLTTLLDNKNHINIIKFSNYFDIIKELKS